MDERYRDMLSLPHPVSQRHPRMSMDSRAAQFAPFAALQGYEAAVAETARHTETQTELSEDRIQDLDLRLRLLQARIAEHPEVRVTWFVPDARKAGGAYVSARGRVRRLDPVSRLLVLSSGEQIPIPAISELDGPVFADLEEF